MKQAQPTPARTLLAAFAVAAMVSGCRLVDQRTFERAGLYRQPAVLASNDYAARAQPLPPLAVIRFGTANNLWESPLVAAARAAQVRKADVQFDVVAPVPVSASPALQDAEARAGAADAARVAEALEADGIDAGRIHIGSRGDAGNPPREVEVYVR